MSLPKCYRFTTRSSSATSFFFFNYTATTEIYTLSLHDALPIRLGALAAERRVTEPDAGVQAEWAAALDGAPDRKSTRLNSSHPSISYAVFCLKKKKNTLPESRFKRKKNRRKK